MNLRCQLKSTGSHYVANLTTLNGDILPIDSPDGAIVTAVNSRNIQTITSITADCGLPTADQTKTTNA